MGTHTRTHRSARIRHRRLIVLIAANRISFSSPPIAPRLITIHKKFFDTHSLFLYSSEELTTNTHTRNESEEGESSLEEERGRGRGRAWAWKGGWVGGWVEVVWWSSSLFFFFSLSTAAAAAHEHTWRERWRVAPVTERERQFCVLPVLVDRLLHWQPEKKTTYRSHSQSERVRRFEGKHVRVLSDLVHHLDCLSFRL